MMERLGKIGRSHAAAALAVLLLAAAMALSGCSAGEPAGKVNGAKTVWYEIFVRSFADSNGDGVGDLNGITQKLDYLQDLGVGGIWLTPINPSPSYHGYDVTDYYAVNPQFGTMDDFKRLTNEAHKRGIQIVMDLVVNHTSSQHPWFASSAGGKASPYRNWYTWAEDSGRPMPGDGAAGGNPWHERGGAHYLGIFSEGMPDLNFDNPDVRKEIVKVGQFWLKQGVDGFRLDAAKHVYEDFKSTAKSPETVKKNQDWWAEFRRGLNEVRPDAYVVGEVWDSASVIAPFLASFNSAFNFDLAGKLVASARSEKSGDFAFSLKRIYGLYDKSSGGKFIEAPFLTNHDQNRVMSELAGNVDHAKTAASLLLTMPGRPFVYYGEEIGMKGAKPDEAIREPFVWNEGGKPGGVQTSWEASKYNKDGAVSVETELKDPNSLLRHYKKLIGWRNELPSLQSGAIDEFAGAPEPVAAYVRGEGNDRVLVAVNLSGKTQTVPLAGADGKPAFSKLLHATSDGAKASGGKLELPAYATAILK